jgi:hypothetical protein
VVFGLGVATALAAGGFAFPRALYLRREQPLEFRHKRHAEKSGTVRCSDCHSFREGGTFEGIPRIAACAACHAERVGTSKAEAILVDSYITQGKETACWKFYRQPPNVWFPHTIHTLAKLTCQELRGTVTTCSFTCASPETR